MALNMSDPAAVMDTYAAVVEEGINWLLLQYTNDYCDELELHSFGDGGLEELKTKIPDLNSIYIAFYREEADVNPAFLLINYIPPSASPVQRAQAHVHSRRVGIIFKRHQIVYTVDDLSLLTAAKIREIVQAETPPMLPPKSENPPKRLQPNRRDFTQAADEPVRGPTPLSQPSYSVPFNVVPSSGPPKRSFSDSRTVPSSSQQHTRYPTLPSGPADALFRHQNPPSVPVKGGGLISSILRRKKKGSRHFDEPSTRPHWNAPPIPPKEEARLVRQRSQSLTGVSHGRASPDSLNSEELRAKTHASEDYFHQLHSRWAKEGVLALDADERARRREELQQQRKEEQQRALEEEAERQRQLKWERQQFMQQEQEEEELRKRETEAEIRRIAQGRRQKEIREKEEEERKRQELEERKRQDRERRLEEHRKLEHWRKEQVRKAEMDARKAEAARRQGEIDRQQKIKQAEAELAQSQEWCGWVSLLTSETLTWRRRYFKMDRGTMVLYRNINDSHILDEIPLRGRLTGMKEWSDGYEDLKAIPFSFAVEFNDGEPVSMYTDSEAEKFRLLGMLSREK